MKMTKIKEGKLCVGNDCSENSFFEMKNESSNNATPKDNMDEKREYLQQFIAREGYFNANFSKFQNSCSEMGLIPPIGTLLTHR